MSRVTFFVKWNYNKGKKLKGYKQSCVKLVMRARLPRLWDSTCTHVTVCALGTIPVNTALLRIQHTWYTNIRRTHHKHSTLSPERSEHANAPLIRKCARKHVQACKNVLDILFTCVLAHWNVRTLMHNCCTDCCIVWTRILYVKVRTPSVCYI